MSNLPSLAQCRGDSLSGQEWFDIWDNDACYNAYWNFIYASGGPVQWNEENWVESQGDFVNIFNKYLGEGQRITIPGAEGYNPFQETLASTCNRIPGVCDTALKAFCQGKSTNPSCPNCKGPFGCGPTCTTREGIASNAGVLEFCGCYAPLPDVQQAANVIKNNPECDPLCTRIETIHLDDGNGGTLECQNNTCIIDDVTIQAAASTISGGINFTQICPNCDPCTCIISGINISETTGQVEQLQTDFNQFCGQNSLCLTIQPDGVDQPVNCQEAIVPTTSTSFTIPWILIIGGVILLIVIILIIAAARPQKRTLK